MQQLEDVDDCPVFIQVQYSNSPFTAHHHNGSICCETLVDWSDGNKLWDTNKKLGSGLYLNTGIADKTRPWLWSLEWWLMLQMKFYQWCSCLSYPHYFFYLSLFSNYQCIISIEGVGKPYEEYEFLRMEAHLKYTSPYGKVRTFWKTLPRKCP